MARPPQCPWALWWGTIATPYCVGGGKGKGGTLFGPQAPPTNTPTGAKIQQKCTLGARAHHGTMPKVGQLWGAQQPHWAMQGPWCPWGACCGTCTPPGGCTTTNKIYCVCVGGGWCIAVPCAPPWPPKVGNVCGGLQVATWGAWCGPPCGCTTCTPKHPPSTIKKKQGGGCKVLLGGCHWPVGGDGLPSHPNGHHGPCFGPPHVFGPKFCPKAMLHHLGTNLNFNKNDHFVGGGCQFWGANGVGCPVAHPSAPKAPATCCQPTWPMGLKLNPI